MATDDTTSTLPPSQRDIVETADMVRAHNRNLRNLGQGFGSGRMVQARLVGPPVEAEDAIGDGGGDTADDTQYEWEDGDRHTVATAGVDQVVTLSHVPVEESLFVRWHPDGGGGVPITGEHWTLVGNVVTIPDPGILAADDEFSFQYQWDPGQIIAPDAADSLYDAAVLALPGLLGYWRLAESSGLVMEDSSGNNRHGVYSADVVLGASALLTGDPDTSAHFPALSSPYGMVPFDTWMNTPEFTIAFWAATDAISSGILAYPNRDTDYRSWQYIQTSGGGVSFTKIQSGTVGNTLGASGLDDTDRHMVALTYGGGEIQHFIDGVPAGPPVAASGDPSTSALFAIGGTYVGAGTWWDPYFYKGRLGKVAWYDHVLTDPQLLNLWTIGSTGAP